MRLLRTVYAVVVPFGPAIELSFVGQVRLKNIICTFILHPPSTTTILHPSVLIA